MDSTGRSQFQRIPRGGGASDIKDRRRSRKDSSVNGRNSIGRQMEEEVGRCQGLYLFLLFKKDIKGCLKVRG